MRRFSPTAIGIFVFGGLLISFAAIAYVASGRLFSDKTQYVCYFTGSVNGLKVGAAVKFKGVELGRVVAIRLSLAKPGENRVPAWKINPNNIALPVVIELEQRQLLRKGSSVDFGNRDNLRAAIREGLRAQLAMESLLTGLLYVDLDFLPGTPYTLYEPPDSALSEIPTRPADLEMLQKKLMEAVRDIEKLNLSALVDSGTRAMNAVATLAADPELPKTIASLHTTLGDAQSTIIEARSAINNAKAAVGDMRKLMARVETEFGPMERKITDTLDHVDKTLATANTTLEGVGTVVNPTAPPIVELNRTLVAVREAATNLADLSRMLDRNPSILIRGRYFPDEDKK
ncbi:MAG TPA: MlaD family protein [Candidatus Binataceae bacterium]|jgi:paraquat-inducible protein B|nr:MlaD family protein [Candidatus Binataceae bacterium]